MSKIASSVWIVQFDQLGPSVNTALCDKHPENSHPHVPDKSVSNRSNDVVLPLTFAEVTLRPEPEHRKARRNCPVR